MRKKISLGWWIVGGWIVGFIISSFLRLIMIQHLPFDFGMVIWESILCMSFSGICGMFYDVSFDVNQNLYHGGCYNCTKRKKSYCKQCCYFKCNWELPDLNDSTLEELTKINNLTKKFPRQERI